MAMLLCRSRIGRLIQNSCIRPALGSFLIGRERQTMQCGWILLLSALATAVPAQAEQKTGPVITGDDSLTWNGITLYGVIDTGDAGPGLLLRVRGDRSRE